MTNTTTRLLSFNMKSPIVCNTDGKGLWSSSRRTVTVRRIVADYISSNDNELYITFRVYFTKKDWNIGDHGLIYTDHGFIRDLRKGMNQMPAFRGILAQRGLAMVDYTEQGMQGENFVSVCVLLKGKRMYDFMNRLDIDPADYITD